MLINFGDLFKVTVPFSKYVFLPFLLNKWMNFRPNLHRCIFGKRERVD